MQIKVAFLVFGFVASASAGTIDLNLIHKVKSAGSHDAVLVLPQVIDEVLANPSLSSVSGDAKTDRMVSLMQKVTQVTQAPFMAILSQLGVAEKATQFWISNKVSIANVTMEVIDALALLPGDFRVRLPIIVSISPSIHHGESYSSAAQNPLQWGVTKIRANQAWEQTQGHGIVVANIDTGVNIGHVALSKNYAGAWMDPYYNRSEPNDNHGHGTHTMGSICGTENGIGVAPAAKWIACRGLDDDGSGNDAGLSTCAQFILTTSPRPQVVSNSWGGGSGDDFFNSEITAWRNAGIIPVFAIGNSGFLCETANSPGDQPGLISVGSTDFNDSLAIYSSRGPSVSGLLKPEVTAPGDEIVSAGKGIDNYVTMSGTSMATPHVAGAIALMLSVKPNLTFNEVLTTLENTADHPAVDSYDLSCGTPSDEDYPNHSFGYGRINVARALGLYSDVQILKI